LLNIWSPRFPFSPWDGALASASINSSSSIRAPTEKLWLWWKPLQHHPQMSCQWQTYPMKEVGHIASTLDHERWKVLGRPCQYSWSSRSLFFRWRLTGFPEASNTTSKTHGWLMYYFLYVDANDRASLDFVFTVQKAVLVLGLCDHPGGQFWQGCKFLGSSLSQLRAFGFFRRYYNLVATYHTYPRSLRKYDSTRKNVLVLARISYTVNGKNTFGSATLLPKSAEQLYTYSFGSDTEVLDAPTQILARCGWICSQPKRRHHILYKDLLVLPFCVVARLALSFSLFLSFVIHKK
jgi:hypothetical protein